MKGIYKQLPKGYKEITIEEIRKILTEVFYGKEDMFNMPIMTEGAKKAIDDEIRKQANDNKFGKEEN